MRTELRLAGFGGQGIITMGKILGRAAVVYDGREAVLTEDYGPEKMGGWSKADLIVSEGEIRYPQVEDVDVLVALSQDGFERFHGTLSAAGEALLERDLVRPAQGWSRRTTRVPALETAASLGRKVVANIVMLGALVERTGVVTPDAALSAVLDTVPRGTEELNEAALEKGREFVRGVGS